MSQEQIARFKKISYSQFEGDFMGEFNSPDSDIEHFKNTIRNTYENIKMPSRATEGSAGYDICTPIAIELNPGDEIKIPTGLRVEMHLGWFMSVYPRSSLGFKGIAIANTIPIIDSDYAYADNEGHIWIKLVNRGKKTIFLEENERIVQGVFMKFGTTYNDSDDIKADRNGGIGSTGR